MFKVDVYLRVRRAVMVDGMSMREAARVFGLHRDTVRKMLAYSVPPGYRRQNPPKRPKLEPYAGVIDRIFEDDLGRPRKQRHTAKHIFERLRNEHGFDGGYTTVKDYVRENRRQTLASLLTSANRSRTLLSARLSLGATSVSQMRASTASTWQKNGR